MQPKQPIMIIDDDPINNFLSKLAIKETYPDATVVEFENAVDGLKFLRANKQERDQLPWLILLDLNMPIMEGWGFLDEYNAIRKELVTPPLILVLSASDYSEDIAKAEGTDSVTAYIIKPLTAGKLKEFATAKM